MAKYMFYADGVPLINVPCTQNNIGAYYYSDDTNGYYAVAMKEFGDAKDNLPKGFKRYTNGSHSKNVDEGAWDYSRGAGVALTCDKDLKMDYSSSASGSWCRVIIEGDKVRLVHTYNWSKGIIKAGSVICYIAPQSVTGFPPHLHASCETQPFKDIVWSNDAWNRPFASGDRVYCTAEMPLRESASTSGKEILQIEEGDNIDVDWDQYRYQNKIVWQHGKCKDKTGWFNTAKATGSKPVDPVEPCLEYKTKILELETEIEELELSNDKLSEKARNQAKEIQHLTLKLGMEKDELIGELTARELLSELTAKLVGKKSE